MPKVSGSARLGDLCCESNYSICIAVCHMPMMPDHNCVCSRQPNAVDLEREKSTSHFPDDMHNAVSSGANANLSMNALSSLIGETEAMAIRSKSLNYDYLTISDSTASMLKVLMIGAFPLAYLGIGAAVVLRRRRLQNEPV